MGRKGHAGAGLLTYFALKGDKFEGMSENLRSWETPFMTCKRCLLLAGLALLALPCANVQAGPFVGVYVGGPYYYRPYYGGYYYYPPAVPVYVAPAPPAPATPGTIISTTPSAPLTVPNGYVPPPPPDAPVGRLETRGDEIDRLVGQLSNPDDKVRSDTALQLGRMKARRASGALEQVLGSDRSADVRDAAARALGLIGMPASVPALQRAVQTDDDKGVRTSAQYAIDVIRTR
jgi:hypothetical protein